MATIDPLGWSQCGGGEEVRNTAQRRSGGLTTRRCCHRCETCGSTSCRPEPSKATSKSLLDLQCSTECEYTKRTEYERCYVYYQKPPSRWKRSHRTRRTTHDWLHRCMSHVALASQQVRIADGSCAREGRARCVPSVRSASRLSCCCIAAKRRAVDCMLRTY